MSQQQFFTDMCLHMLKQFKVINKTTYGSDLNDDGFYEVYESFLKTYAQKHGLVIPSELIEFIGDEEDEQVTG